MARLGSLDYLMFFAPDVEALARFYREVLDATPIEEGYPHWARLRLANVDLGIRVRPEGGEPSEGGGQPAFRVRDVAALRVHLEAHDVACEDYAAIPGAVKLAFRDPAGNVLQAVQWGANMKALAGVPSTSH